MSVEGLLQAGNSRRKEGKRALVAWVFFKQVITRAISTGAEIFTRNGENMVDRTGRGERHPEDRRRHLEKSAIDCGWRRPGDVRREAAEKWLADTTGGGMSARPRNAYRDDLTSFRLWTDRTGRLSRDPAHDPLVATDVSIAEGTRDITPDESERILSAAAQGSLMDTEAPRQGLKRRKW